MRPHADTYSVLIYDMCCLIKNYDCIKSQIVQDELFWISLEVWHHNGERRGSTSQACVTRNRALPTKILFFVQKMLDIKPEYKK